MQFKTPPPVYHCCEAVAYHTLCSTLGWIHIPEPIEMHNRFPLVLHLGPTCKLSRLMRLRASTLSVT
jgi:hypothetical protein